MEGAARVKHDRDLNGGNPLLDVHIQTSVSDLVIFGADQHAHMANGRLISAKIDRDLDLRNLGSSPEKATTRLPQDAIAFSNPPHVAVNVAKPSCWHSQPYDLEVSSNGCLRGAVCLRIDTATLLGPSTSRLRRYALARHPEMQLKA